MQMSNISRKALLKVHSLKTAALTVEMYKT